MRRFSRGLLAGALAIAGTALAVNVPLPVASAGGSVTISPTSGPIGTVVTFSGSNCTAEDPFTETSDTVRAYLRSSGTPGNPALGYALVDTSSPSRSFSGTFTIPDEWVVGAAPTTPAPGTYDVIFDCSGYVYGEVSMTSPTPFTITTTATTTTAPTTTSTTTTSTTTTSTTTAPTTTSPSTTTTTAVSGASPTTTTTTTTTTTAPPATGFTPPATVPTDAEPLTGATPSSATAGGTLLVDETGFVPGEVVEIVVYSTPTRVGRLTADGTGRVRGSVVLPAGLSAGQHTLVLFGGDSIRSATLTIATAASTSLAPAPAATPTRVQTVPLAG